MAFTDGAGENNDLCMLSCAFLYCTKDVTIELLGLAKSRPAMKRTHCVAMLDNNNEIGVFMFSRFRTNIFSAAYQGLVVLSPCQSIRTNFPVLCVRYQAPGTWDLNLGLGT